MREHSHVGTGTHQLPLEPDDILGQHPNLPGKLFLVNLLATLALLLATFALVSKRLDVAFSLVIQVLLYWRRVRKFRKNVRHDRGVEVEDRLLLVVFLDPHSTSDLAHRVVKEQQNVPWKATLLRSGT